MFKKAWKGIKKYMGEKLQACKEILASNKNRVIVGVVMVGTGLGLIASGYVKVPA